MNKRDLIFDNYQQMVNGVVHYQSQQNEIRILCLKIILGTMGIIGLLGLSNLGLPRSWFSLIGSILPLLSLFAITSSLLNDLFYREQMKMGFFFEARKLEVQHSWIPLFHHCLLIEESDRKYYSPGKVQLGFYKRCVAVLLILSGSAVLRYPLFSEFYWKVIIVIFFFLLFFGYFFVVDYFIKSFFSPYILTERKFKRTFSSATETFVSSLHSRGKDLIQNLSDTKMKYKNFTLTVITMIFLAGAFVSGSSQTFFGVEGTRGSVQHEFLASHRIIMIAYLAFLAAMSVGLIRYLDIRVCHAQTRNLFFALKAMEEKYPNLSKPFAFLTKSVYGRRFDPAIIDSLFYFSFNVGIIIFSGVIMLSQLITQEYTSRFLIPYMVLFTLLVFEFLNIYQTYKQKIDFK